MRAALLEEPDVRAVLLTHNETSTGITNPIPELAAIVRELAPDALILVDAISALGAVPFEMDAWGLDLVVTGSQKAWMSAPGMAFAAVAERAWAAMESARMPRFYFDLQRAKESAATGQTPWTPAVAVMYQVDEGLRLMEEETPAGVFARHAACAAATRAGPHGARASRCSPTRPTPRRPSPPRGSPRTSTGRPSTRRSRSAASSWPAARASSRGGSSASATSARSRSRTSSAPSR